MTNVQRVVLSGFLGFASHLVAGFFLGAFPHSWWSVPIGLWLVVVGIMAAVWGGILFIRIITGKVPL